MKVIRKYGHFIIVPIYLVFLSAGVSACRKPFCAQVHILHTRLDDMIPFCEYFIIPYVLWFWVCSGGCHIFWTDRQEQAGVFSPDCVSGNRHDAVPGDFSGMAEWPRVAPVSF